MNNCRTHILPALLCCCLTFPSGGCDMIEYHPYDLDIDGETGINAKNMQRIEAELEGRKRITFAVISDTQRWYDETEEAVESLNGQKDLDFVVHTGDLSDFGLKLEFEKQRDILNRLSVPYVCILGNHDCLATGEEVFNRIFGENNFSFNAGNVHFLCLNTNALEFGYDTAIPDFQYIRNDRQSLPEGIEKTVAAMHAGPFSEQFNNNVAHFFEQTITSFPSLQFCIYGHGHNVSAEELFEDGVMYYECASANKRSYLLFTINDNDYTYEVVSY